MEVSANRCKAIISSDWNQCLAPCGPFDPITFSYPELAPELTAVFREYTGNRIALGTANRRILELLPRPLSIRQMDAYLEERFCAYTGVAELIAWCAANDILFMINTTGMAGYFQRVFAGGRIPTVPAISAGTLIRYPPTDTDPPRIYDLHEIQDKGRNTRRAAHRLSVPGDRIVIVGDSGGDGPHFAWGKAHGAFTVGCMTKPSLAKYCRRREIDIDLLFGHAYSDGEERNEREEMRFDFMELRAVLERFL